MPTTSTRCRSYKNVGLDSSEMRRRREQEGIQIRKQKREQQLIKRRNVDVSPTTIDSETEADIIQSQDSGINKNIIEKLYSDNENEQLVAAHKFGRLLSRDPNPLIKEITQSGLLHRFVSFLRNKNNYSLQLEAAWVLTSVASGTLQNTKLVIDAGAIPVFIELLLNSHQNVQEQVLWGLGNIAGDSVACRDILLNAGILSPLLQILSKDNPLSLTRQAVWTFSNLCRRNNSDFDKIIKGVPILAKLLNHVDVDILNDACWALSYLSDGTNEKIQVIIDAGICTRLVQLLMHPQNNVVLSALRTVGNIVSGDDNQTQLILNCNALPRIKHLLTSRSSAIKKEACWTMSNIAAGNTQQIQSMIDIKVFPILITIMQVADFKTQKEAAWAITNATNSGTADQIKYLVEVGVIPPICNFLTIVDSELVQVALHALDNILKAGEEFADTANPYTSIIEECGGLDKIEYLQSHENHNIYFKSILIIQKYFGDEEEEDNHVAPLIENNQYQFNLDQFAPNEGFSF